MDLELLEIRLVKFIQKISNLVHTIKKTKTGLSITERRKVLIFNGNLRV
jgi:hypothetical protein